MAGMRIDIIFRLTNSTNVITVLDVLVVAVNFFDDSVDDFFSFADDSFVSFFSDDSFFSVRAGQLEVQLIGKPIFFRVDTLVKH